MDNISNISSEEELLQLRNDGKISEDDYQDLLETMNKPAPDSVKPSVAAEPQFEAFRIRVLTCCLMICTVGLPIGLMLELPYVWGLSILGLIVAPLKLSRIKGSWVAKLMNKRR